MEKIEFLNEVQAAAGKLIHNYGVPDMVMLFLRWVTSFVAVFLMILDRTKWKYSNNIMTSLLAPYLFSSLPIVIFQFLRTGFGKWIALLTVVLRLFLPNHFPESLDIPSATILLIVATPNELVEAFRDDLRYTGGSVCLLTSFYLLDKHTKACGGFKMSFTEKEKITYTICLFILSVYPILSAFDFLFYL
ncbi:Cold-regulated 413 protein [Arabidopsis thaliana x Arabidopsis arenosa]|uniref:Cold-regulated 413 protein n=2 Tax=Arabidopsis thaliana x Arabidopsis arenosa TaxID=1240361 RepID=A0A8T2A477_9BRAS|nr:Cold-regulated 413 protein [Arabidopsis thaliana x Arabidopsis arenosa]